LSIHFFTEKHIELAMSNHLLYYIPIPEEIKTGNDFQLPFCMKDLHFPSAVLMTHNKKTPEINRDSRVFRILFVRD